MPIYTIIATLLLYPLYTWITSQVAVARRTHQHPAPKMEGDLNFMRYLRVQMNTVERLVIFLPLLWITAIYGNDLFAGICGYIWIIGRLIYALGYYREAQKRQIGFLINAAIETILFGAIIYFLYAYFF